jgi:putative thioredoxin
MANHSSNHEVQDFERDVLQQSHQIPVLVDFWADWCGPCKILGPVLERLANESDHSWKLAKVDTERHREVAARYNIRSIPNVKLFVDGNVISEFVGALPEPMVKQWLRKNIPSPFRTEIARAQGLLAEGKSLKAQTILEVVLQKEPANQQARVTLAQTLLFSDPEKAVDLVSGMAEDSEYFDAVDAIRTISAMMKKVSYPDTLPDHPTKPAYLAAIEQMQRGDFDGALEKFIEVIRNDRYYDDDGSRKACIAIFRILGEEHATTQKYRREFSRALY